MKQKEIEKFAELYAEELATPQLSYEMKVGWAAHLLYTDGIVGSIQNAILYGGYIVAAYERNAPPQPNVEEVLANLI